MAFRVLKVVGNSRFCVNLIPQLNLQLYSRFLSHSAFGIKNSRGFSSGALIMSPRHGSGETGSSVAVQDGSRTQSQSVIRVHNKDQIIVQQIAQFENARATELLEFIETVESSQLDHRAIDVIARILCHKLKTEKLNKKTVLKSVGMQKYCHRIRKTCRTMDQRLLVTLLKMFSLLETPADHVTFQMVLQLISKQASTMELPQIVFLNFLLESLAPESKSALTQALQLALPIVFESQLDMQLNPQNLKELVSFLAFTVNSRCKESTVARIVEALLKTPEDFSVANAVDIHRNLVDYWHKVPQVDLLLEKIYSILTSNVQKIDDQLVHAILCRAASRVMRGHVGFYDENFLDACCSRLALSENELLILRCLAPISIMRHINVEFLEKCAELAASDPQRILNDDVLFFALVRGFSGASYKPEKWNILQPMLLEHPATTKDLSGQDLPLIVDYLVLDMLPLNLLEKVFSPEYFPRLEGFLKKSGPYTLVIIYNAIKQLYPEYSGPMPTNSMVKAWKEAASNQVKNFRHLLEAPLQSAFGGESYVITGIVHEGLHIDHCIVMRQGGYPVSIQNQDCQVNSLDDIERPNNSTLVLLKVFGPEAFAANTSRLRGVHSLESKILRSYGHPVVEVDLTQWRDLMESEKLPYLVQKVREHVDKVSI